MSREYLDLHVNRPSPISFTCTQLLDRDQNFQHADSEDTGKTEWHFVSFAMRLSKLCLNP